jgi:hypothetical protein
MEMLNEYQESKQSIIDYLNECEISYRDNKPDQKGGSLVFAVNGIEITYYTVGQCMRIKSLIGGDSLDELNSELSNNFETVKPSYKNNWSDLICKPTIENIELMISVIESLDFDISEELLDSLMQEKTTKRSAGVTFEGTIYERIKERGSTIGGKFGKMVCDASGMDLFQMFAEEYYSCGEIDGVEKDPLTNKPISIFECQSGIHRGEFLDDGHLNKTLGKYLYDSEIIPTVKKIVILAGGYTKEHLSMLKERSSELMRRQIPIELVLLKTEREGDQIRVVRLDF